MHNKSEEQLMRKTQEINEGISKLWNEVGALKNSALCFYHYKDLLKARGGILFVGTGDVLRRNQAQSMKRFLKQTDPQLDSYYKESLSHMRLLTCQAQCRSRCSYVSIHLGLRTKQREFPAAKTARSYGAKNGKFVSEIEALSLSLVKTAIDALKPRCVVAINVMSVLFDKKLQRSCGFSISDYGFRCNGFYLWDKKIPTLFCDSLGALSYEGAFDRLAWHVRKAVKWNLLKGKGT